MVLFGLGYAFSTGVGCIVEAVTGSKSARQSAEAVAAFLSLPMDPVGAVAALAMPHVKDAARNGNGVAKAVTAGVAVLSLAESLHGGAMGDDVSA